MIRKFPKIDFKKIDEVEKDPDRVINIVWSWAERSLEDPDLPWETAMNNAASELGLTRAELIVLTAGNDPFKDLTYGLDIYKTLRSLKFEPEEYLEKLFKKSKRKKVKNC